MSCLKEAEDADLEDDGRRAVAGCAEVCDHDVHVEHLEVESHKNFQPVWSRRLGLVAAGVLRLWLTGGIDFCNSGRVPRGIVRMSRN